MIPNLVSFANSPDYIANINIMRTLSIIFYIIGSIMLIVSCFFTNITATWIIGGISVVFLILGCIFQFKTNKRQQQQRYQR